MTSSGVLKNNIINSNNKINNKITYKAQSYTKVVEEYIIQDRMKNSKLLEIIISNFDGLNNITNFFIKFLTKQKII